MRLEVDREQRLGEVGGEPRTVDCERLATGETKALQIKQACVDGELQMRRCRSIASQVEGSYDASRLESGRFNRVVQAVQGAKGLLDLHLGTQARAATSSRHDHPFGPESAKRLTNRVATDPVRLDHCHLARERLGELTVVRTSSQVVAQLRPERHGTLAVERGDA